MVNHMELSDEWSTQRTDNALIDSNEKYWVDD